MKNQQNEELLFPVDKSKSDSLQQLADKLEKMATGNKLATNEKEETIADDFDATSEEISSIRDAEEDMRGLLKTMGLDYDALIRMDGKSVYARAVSANPAVLNHVKSSKNPVLEAVKIALGFKPYAEFMDKYGSEPEAILKNVRSEIEGQKSKSNDNEKLEKSNLEEALNRPSFSGAVSATKAKKSSEIPSLDDIFGK